MRADWLFSVSFAVIRKLLSVIVIMSVILIRIVRCAILVVRGRVILLVTYYHLPVQIVVRRNKSASGSDPTRRLGDILIWDWPRLCGER